MQIVIDIPEQIYQHYKKVWQKRSGSMPESCIANGIPLPKGHGRLIDADAVLEEPIGNTYKDIEIAETIIEADEES